jgi:hypothetical protein
MTYSAILAAIARHNGASPSAQAKLDDLVDELVDRYLCWREECVSVQASYDNWSRAEAGERRLAFSAHVAALDREQHAAVTYQRCAEKITRSFPATLTPQG